MEQENFQILCRGLFDRMGHMGGRHHGNTGEQIKFRLVADDHLAGAGYHEKAFVIVVDTVGDDVLGVVEMIQHGIVAFTGSILRSEIGIGVRTGEFNGLLTDGRKYFFHGQHPLWNYKHLRLIDLSAIISLIY